MQITAIAITRLIKNIFKKTLKKPVPGTGRLAVRRFALLLRSSRVCGLQKEIAIFLRHKNLPYADQFFDLRWLARLALLTDINTHLNALNVKLQGKDILVTDMHTNITAFEVKLRLWETQLANSQLEHFSRLAACVSDDVEPDTCNTEWRRLSEGGICLPFCRSQATGCRLQAVYRPLTFPWTTPLSLHMELVELQCNGKVLQLVSIALLPRHRPLF